MKRNIKYYKMLLVIGLALMPVLSSSIPVYAEEEKILTINEPMVIRFSTSAISGSSQNNGVLDIVRVGLTITAYPKSNPGSQMKETVYIENGKSTTFTKLYPVAILGTDGITYKGDFTFTVFYDTVTASLKVDGVDVAIDSNVVRNASIWPEAWLDPAVISVAHSALPFSSVKAVISSDPNYIKDFNERINGGITDKIVLSTSQYGSNVKTETTLKMYI